MDLVKLVIYKVILWTLFIRSIYCLCYDYRIIGTVTGDITSWRTHPKNIVINGHPTQSRIIDHYEFKYVDDKGYTYKTGFEVDYPYSRKDKMKIDELYKTRVYRRLKDPGRCVIYWFLCIVIGIFYLFNYFKIETQRKGLFIGSPLYLIRYPYYWLIKKPVLYNGYYTNNRNIISLKFKRFFGY